MTARIIWYIIRLPTLDKIWLLSNRKIRVVTNTRKRHSMDIYVARKRKKDGQGTYLVLEARGQWGNILISFDPSKILQIIPSKVDHRALDEKGVKVGRLDE